MPDASAWQLILWHAPCMPRWSQERNWTTHATSRPREPTNTARRLTPARGFPGRSIAPRGCGKELKPVEPVDLGGHHAKGKLVFALDEAPTEFAIEIRGVRDLGPHRYQLAMSVSPSRAGDPPRPNLSPRGRHPSGSGRH